MRKRQEALERFKPSLIQRWLDDRRAQFNRRRYKFYTELQRRRPLVRGAGGPFKPSRLNRARFFLHRINPLRTGLNNTLPRWK
jgi:hypothetical protein